MSRPPVVSVIIPVYNDSERVRLCLDALAAQNYPREQMEVIVVDNGSDDPPRELVESYPFCRFAQEQEPGSYAARNCGLGIAQGALLAFTDSDCVPQPAWLSSGVAMLESDPDVALVGGRIEVFPADEHAASAVELYDCVFGLPQEVNVNKCHFAATANAFSRRSVIDQVGPFLQGVKSGGDVEFGHRVHDAGLRLAFSENAVIRHPARKSLKALQTQAKRHAGGRIDKRRQMSQSPVRLRDIRNVFRVLFPPLSHFSQSKKKLRSRGVGWGSILHVWFIMFRLRWLLLWAGLRSVLGKETERR